MYLQFVENHRKSSNNRDNDHNYRWEWLVVGELTIIHYVTNNVMLGYVLFNVMLERFVSMLHHLQFHNDFVVCRYSYTYIYEESRSLDSLLTRHISHFVMIVDYAIQLDEEMEFYVWKLENFYFDSKFSFKIFLNSNKFSFYYNIFL